MQELVAWTSLSARAAKIFREEGFVSLLNRAQSYLRYRTRSIYQERVEALLRWMATERRDLTLNGVTVPIEIHWAESYIPYYDHRYPTANDPSYEHVESEAIRSYTEPGDDVVIVGGGLGVTTVVARQETEGHITVFEQSEYTIDILRRTCEVNGCTDDVSIHHATIGQPGGSNLTHTVHSEGEVWSPADLPAADVFEMDCEGAETSILQSMAVEPRILLVETHGNHDEVVRIVENRGYDIVDVVDDGVGQHPSFTHIRARKAE